MRNTANEVIFLIAIVGFLAVIPGVVPFAYAGGPAITVDWTLNGDPKVAVEFDSGYAFNQPFKEVSVRVVDHLSGFDPGAIDTIDVLITSSLDPIGSTLTLTETGVATNEFTGKNLTFLTEPFHLFEIGDTVKYQITGDPTDPITLDCDAAAGDDTLDSFLTSFFGFTDFETIFIYSETEWLDLLGGGFGFGGIGPEMIESDVTPCLFEGEVTFTAGPSDEATGMLNVSEGDIITWQDLTLGAGTANALIVPTVDGKGAITAEIGGTITATYLGESSTIDVIGVGEPGRGGGGVVRPGLVVDAPPPDPEDGSDSSDSGGSGCNGDCTPPTLGVDSNLNRIVYDGFSYNGHAVNVEQFYTPYPLVTVQVGEPNRAILKIYDNGGTQNVAHVELGFGLGKDKSFSENKAAIIIDISRDGRVSVETFDPENVLDNVSVTTMKEKCGDLVSAQCLVVIIDHTFREPLEFNMVGTQVWDFSLNSWQNFYNHGVHIVGDSLNPPKTKQVAFGTKEMTGLFTLTRIDKIEDKWVDEFGNVYLHKGNDHFVIIETIPRQVIEDYVTMHGCDRMCNWFDKYQKNQELIAQSKLHAILGGNIQNDMPTFTPAPTVSKLSRADNSILQSNIQAEIVKAEKLFEQEYDVFYNFEFAPPSETIKLLKSIQDYQKITLKNHGGN